MLPNKSLARTSRTDDISSDYSQRRAHSLTGLINETTSRNGQIENGSYGVTTAKAPSDTNGNDTKKRSRSFARPTIRSAVPNSQLITIIKRASQSEHAGQKVELHTNHFRINFSKQTNELILYQFDFKLFIRDGLWRSCRKDERLQVLKKILEQEHFPLVWYDEGKNLYSIENLILNYEQAYQCEIKHEPTGRTNKFLFLIINLVKTYKLKNIFDFIQKEISQQPHDLIRILETLFKQTQISDMIKIKNQSYPKHQPLKDIGCGRGMALGFYQGIVLGERGPTININNIFCCFYQNYNLVEFISCYLNHDIRECGIPSKYQLIVGKILETLWLLLPRADEIGPYRFQSFHHSANGHTFNNNKNEQIVSCSHDKKNIYIIHYPNLPLIKLYHPDYTNQTCIVPMEFITVDQGQLSLEPFTTKQYAEIKKIIALRPQECYEMIQSITNEHLKNLGITVDNEMLMVPARILPQLQIKYNDVIERVQIGKWYLDNRFNKVREIRTWAVVFINQHKLDNRQIDLTRDFVQKIRLAMSKYAIQFNSSPIEKSDVAVPQIILAHINELKMQGCEVIIYIFNQVDNDIYDVIKDFENVQTDTIIQCVLFDQLMSISDSCDMNMYIQNNLVKELRAKLGGVNQFVSLMRALTSPPARSDIFMFFGIDSSHITC
ncbi:unnamed protein product [Rotaria sordida]|uniref:Piwi domain-containing protein n=1 Tax=Rotaria sordida TaxID=392033 RepID=A0A819KV27_9BILA|nr:unnamed protein product [Rotaria sordida]